MSRRLAHVGLAAGTMLMVLGAGLFSFLGHARLGVPDAAERYHVAAMVEQHVVGFGLVAVGAVLLALAQCALRRPIAGGPPAP